MGGGFRESRIGELAIARANLILKADGIKVDMVPIHNDPDEAALIGSLFLAPAWIFKGTTASWRSISAEPTFAPAWCCRMLVRHPI